MAGSEKLGPLNAPDHRPWTSELSHHLLLDFVCPGSDLQAVVAACTGAFLLHVAGLICAKKAITHRCGVHEANGLIRPEPAIWLFA